MIPSFHYLKLIQLVLAALWCLRFRPTIKWLFILLTIPLLSMFIPGSLESGDFTTHVVRAMDLSRSFQLGIFPVRWAAILHGEYGYPLFNFVSVLPYYVLALFHLFGITFVSGMKLFLAGVYLGSGITCFLFLRALIKNNNGAMVGAVLYAFAPYTLINLNFRAAAGELGGFMLLPLIAYAVLKKKTHMYTIALLFLLLMHPGVTLIGLPWIFLALILKKTWREFVFPTLLAIGVSSFYLFPSVFEARFTEQVLHAQRLWSQDVFPPLMHLFWSPWRLGFLFQGHFGELAYVIGPFGWIAAIVMTWKLYTKKVERKIKPILLLFLLIFIIGIFMLQPVSLFVWNSFALLRKLQFPSRFMLYPVFSSAVLCAYCTAYIPKKILPFLLAIMVCWTGLNWAHRAYKPEIDDNYLESHLKYVSFEYERLPEAMPLWKKNIDAPRVVPIEILNGDGEYRSIIQTPRQRQYWIVAHTPITLQENTLYFPGWVMMVNGESKQARVSDRGLMQLDLQPGEYTVEFYFAETPLRQFSNTMSLFSSVILVGWIATTWYDRSRKRL